MTKCTIVAFTALCLVNTEFVELLSHDPATIHHDHIERRISMRE